MTHHAPNQMKWMADYKTEWYAQFILTSRNKPRFEKVLKSQKVKTFDEYMKTKKISLHDYHKEMVPRQFIEDTNQLVQRYNQEKSKSTLDKEELARISKKAMKTIESYIR